MMNNKEYKVLDSGIDSLVIGFSIEAYLYEESFSILKEAKEKAGEKLFGGKGSSVTWFDREFTVSARGAKGYEWILTNNDVQVSIAKDAQGGRVYPEVFVTFRSIYLWSKGPKQAFLEFGFWLSTWAVITKDTVSRVDLCMDLEMEIPEIDLQRDIVSRARAKSEFAEKVNLEKHVEGRNCTGFRAGLKPIMVRVYDKTREIKKSRKEWFKEIWLDKVWNGEKSVTRVEFQARRGFLKKISVYSFVDLFERMADMWRYYTHDWLRICVPSDDSHRDRWPVTDWWVTVQEGFSLFGEAYGVLPSKQRQNNYQHIYKQTRGLCLAMAAIKGQTIGPAYGVQVVKGDIEKMLASPDFEKDVEGRMKRIALFKKDDKPYLVDEAIRLGAKLISVEEIEKEEK